MRTMILIAAVITLTACTKEGVECRLKGQVVFEDTAIGKVTPIDFDGYEYVSKKTGNRVTLIPGSEMKCEKIPN
ncbi:hypothetical protein [Stenotrophomonas phage RAS14]